MLLERFQDNHGKTFWCKLKIIILIDTASFILLCNVELSNLDVQLNWTEVL